MPAPAPTANTLSPARIAELMQMRQRWTDAMSQAEHGSSPFREEIAAIDRQLAGGSLPAPAAPRGPTPLTAGDVWNQISQYEGSGYQNQLLPDTLINDWLNRTTASQGSSILDELTRRRGSGEITGVGYDAAMNEYNRQRTAAEGQLRNVGEGVIAGGRGNLASILSDARTRYGQNTAGFNMQNLIGDVTNRATQFTGGLENALSSAVGGTNYFDRNAVMGAIPSAQGSTNLVNPSLVDAITNARSRNTRPVAPTGPTRGVPDFSGGGGGLDLNRHNLASTGGFM